jgi:uncharacterized protein
VRIRRRAGHGGERVRLLFATDFHGSDIVFRKFLNAVEVYEANVAVLGGDLTAKQIVPVVERGDLFVAELLGTEVVVRSEEDVELLVARIRNLGQYPVRLSEGEYRVLEANPEAVEARFRSECNEQVASWMKRAASRLSPLDVPLFVTGGNDDYAFIEEILDEAAYIVNAEDKVVEVAPEVEMISTGYGNPTPWRCPRDVSEEELAAKIDRMASQLRSTCTAIFNLHVPPYGSGLDTCPKLDTSIFPPRPLAGEETPAGSHAVRDAIERHRPLVSLHGHIHESPGIRRLGHTTAVNPGSEYGEGILRSAVIDLWEGGTKAKAQLLAA